MMRSTSRVRGGASGSSPSAVASRTCASRAARTASGQPWWSTYAETGASGPTWCTAVIKAVASVKSCGNLQQAAQDLRDAAGQRNRLVADLAKLKVDRLPDHARLTAALNRAWQASASADNHYAAWADQVAGNKKKLCKKGQARVTDETQAGNRDSGTASQQKKTAADLWNAIAREYGLTQRQPVQL